VSHWGYGLLATYTALALSPLDWRKAGRLASLLTVAVMGYAFHSYHVI
jgi:hypothetical protein